MGGIEFLPHPSSILENAFLSHMYCSDVEKYIDMVALNRSFRELLPVDSVLLPEGEVHSDFAFIEVDIGEWVLTIDCGIETESKFPNHHFPFCFHYEVIDFLEHRREIGGWENSPFLDTNQERSIVNNFKSITWIGFYECFTGDGFEIDSFGKEFSDRKSSTLMFALSIISRIPTSSFHGTESEHMSLRRVTNRSESSIYVTSELFQLFYITICMIFERFFKSLKLRLFDICQMIEFDNVYADIKKLESNTKC